MRIKVLGSRGSMPVSGSRFQEFGGATSCYLIETESHAIYLDAGSGIMDSPKIPDKELLIFLTHPHLDHLLGLPFFPMLSEQDRHIIMYSMNRDGVSTKDQVDYIFSGPAWPLQMENYPSDLVYEDLPDDYHMEVGDIKISWMEGNHPRGSLIYKVEADGKALVYATDYEHSDASDQRLIDFAKGCDLLIYDGQYTEEEYEARVGFGHSTKQHGIDIFKKCEAKKLLFTHHDPMHSDGVLKLQESKIQGKNENISLARAGEVIEL